MKSMALILVTSLLIFAGASTEEHAKTFKIKPENEAKSSEKSKNKNPTQPVIKNINNELQSETDMIKGKSNDITAEMIAKTNPVMNKYVQKGVIEGYNGGFNKGIEAVENALVTLKKEHVNLNDLPASPSEQI
ncbi:hypothetical protein EDEG_02267 [Edhazardia aedis USNM 41457]|uniref:Uncharacterized protein n=1 Tax=Edhazardia aedis (strain USNM 41457) TaxID=1003232 RepID=J9DLE0_EDHAE|nr:hypothetical protein EDEG_02267 [Edhazardia aedis USNM 41457]|eukprot:EJW03410.1 hypothetical protein EDEG_02267 [Edhazardia aedis USNM 41457]